jgi:hypothetical protein
MPLSLSSFAGCPKFSSTQSLLGNTGIDVESSNFYLFSGLDSGSPETMKTLEAFQSVSLINITNK